jgi:hypothetical protein
VIKKVIKSFIQPAPGTQKEILIKEFGETNTILWSSYVEELEREGDLSELLLKHPSKSAIDIYIYI